MILEVANLQIKKSQMLEFEVAFDTAQNECLKSAKGYIKHTLIKGVENPSNYKILIYWETLENHTVDFRESSSFVKWREIIGPFFAEAPIVEHFEFK